MKTKALKRANEEDRYGNGELGRVGLRRGESGIKHQKGEEAKESINFSRCC